MTLAAIVIGLLVMMWPVLTKVQYERLPELAMERKLWYQIALSLFLNWIIGMWRRFIRVFKGSYADFYLPIQAPSLCLESLGQHYLYVDTSMIHEPVLTFPQRISLNTALVSFSLE